MEYVTELSTQTTKVAGWSHYQQYSTWAGVTTGVPLGPADLFGVVPPGQACWEFGVTSATESQIVLRAQANTSGRTICGLLPGSATIDLTLNGDGSSSRTQAGL
jgi:hypothetical protein